jgi:hypothetical protein
MFDMPEEILDGLKQIAQAQQSLMLLNEYKGVPVSYEASIRGIEAAAATFNVHKYQAVCLTLEGETTIQSKPLSLAVRARVTAVDVVQGTATLTDFRAAVYTVARRLAIRVKTNPPVSVEVLIADQSMWGWLENLSLIGLGIYLPRAQIMHDPQDVFQKDMGLRIRLHPPTEEAPIELVGKVAHGTPQQGTYRLGINLSADAEAQRAIEGYIARRQAAIAHELQIIYDRMCARQSQRPLS